MKKEQGYEGTEVHESLKSKVLELLKKEGVLNPHTLETNLYKVIKK